MSRTAVPDPDDRGPAILQITWALTALSIVVTLLRIFVQTKVLRGLNAHDWLMIVALLLQIASQACITEAYNWGMGVHDAYLLMDPAMPWINLLKWVYISTLPGVLCSIFARVSICLLLISLFGSKLWLKWWLIVTTTLVAVLGVLSIAVTWAQADPIEGLWNPLIHARRWNPNVSLYIVFVAGAVWALTDLTFVLFPVIIIWSLQMALHRKLGVCIILAGSLFSLATCVMRILTAREDNLSQTAWGMLWASIEQCLVVILGSAPTLPALRKLNVAFLRRTGRAFVSRVSRVSSGGSNNNKKRGSEKSSWPSDISTAQRSRSTSAADDSDMGRIYRAEGEP